MTRLISRARLSTNGYWAFAALLVLPMSAALAPAAACTKAKVTPSLETWKAKTTTSNGAKITIYTGPTDHGTQLQIAAGVGDYLWVAQQGNNSIMRFSVNGKAALFQTPTSGSAPESIASNGKTMWFSEWATSCVASITPTGIISEYSTVLSETESTGMTTGPKDTAWFGTDASGIGRILANGKVKLYPVADQSSQITGVTLGPDGNIWFIVFDDNNIGKITPAGKVTEYDANFGGDSYSLGIAAGADKRIWFADDNSTTPQIGAIETNGKGLVYYSKGLSGPPIAIVAGPDGNLYFGETGPAIGRITTSGVITEYPLPVTEGSFPVVSLTVGPDKNIWFTNAAHSQLGKLTLPTN